MRRIGTGWLVVIAVLGSVSLLSLARFAVAAPQMTAEQVAAACIEEMSAIEGEMIDGVGNEALDFGDAVMNLPKGTPYGKVFKMGAASSARMDKIATSAASRVQKIWIKCGAKIQRLNGDGSLLAEIEVAHDQVMGAIQVSLQSRQGALASIVLDYIAPE